MIPSAVERIEDFTLETQTGRTYRLDIVNGRISGMTDGLDAVKQAVYMILNIERYKNAIFSWNYGIELSELIGKRKGYVIPELERRITEAIMTDDRVYSVSGFSFEWDKQKCYASFTVKTELGDIKIEDVEVLN